MLHNEVQMVYINCLTAALAVLYQCCAATGDDGYIVCLQVCIPINQSIVYWQTLLFFINSL